MFNREQCIKLWNELKSLKDLHGRFVHALTDCIRNNDFDTCKRLRLEIKKYFDNPDNEISKILIPEGLRGLKLKQQYESQVNVAKKSGLFETIKVKSEVDVIRKNIRGRLLSVLYPEQEEESNIPQEPVIERNGVKYPIPTWREVRETLCKNKEIIKEKSRQGFTKMLIVPFGYDLKTMSEIFKEKVRELDQSGHKPDGSSIPDKGIFDAKGAKVHFISFFKDTYPVYIWEAWDEKQFTYYPKKYSKSNHGGISKDEAIKLNGAWQICFVEDMAEIPETGKTVNGRTQIDRQGSCIKGSSHPPLISEYKEAMDNQEDIPGRIQMQNPENYRSELGQTPEQYLWQQLSYLLDGDKPILIDHGNDEWRGTYFTECWVPALGRVPTARWARDNRYIGLMSFSLDEEDFFRSYYGVRPVVNIK